MMADLVLLATKDYAALQQHREVNAKPRVHPLIPLGGKTMQTDYIESWTSLSNSAYASFRELGEISTKATEKLTGS